MEMKKLVTTAFERQREVRLTAGSFIHLYNEFLNNSVVYFMLVLNFFFDC